MWQDPLDSEFSSVFDQDMYDIAEGAEYSGAFEGQSEGRHEAYNQRYINN